MRLPVALVVSVLGLLAGTPSAFAAGAWWNTDWAFRKELTLDLSAAGANIPGDVADVPVLVRLSIGNFPYFTDAKPDGSDLRLVAGDGKTPLKFHVEKFDAQTQMALLWVRVPQAKGGASAEKFYLYYGNPKASSASDAAGTYDANQALVYHFAGAPGAQDSGPNKIEPQGVVGTPDPAALIGSGIRLDGSAPFSVAAAPATRISGSRGYTISAWVKPDAAQQAVVASAQEGARELALGIEGDKAWASWRDGGAPVRVTQATGSVAGEWHHLALRATADKLTLFVDGVEAGQAAIRLADANAALTIGGSLRGLLDELQVSNVARNDGWIRAAATSQGMIAPLLVYGGDAQQEGEQGTSYFSSTLRNVTVDGWVIIGILGVLFIAAVLIMAGKLLYLGRIARGNARFLEAFHRLRDDPGALEKGDAGASFGISTLWTLYHHGMQETNKRLEGRAAGVERAKVLSPQSIEAIRATMDATQTRAGQKLQAQMVWLTIAIAGGPFLGLLGTVVGVMITFAAIAASGEVNVNAIAPGTAAALVATVAGLGVAIPCLFGYNYLNTRIKEIVADMRVFVDEFVARIAETYS